MCLIAPITPRKKASKKDSSKPAVSGSGSNSPPAARFIKDATTSHSHAVEFPTSHLPTYLFQRSISNTPTIQIMPASTDAPSRYQCLAPAMPACTIPNSSTSAVTPRNAHRASVLSEIDFVQNLSSKLAPAPAAPKGQSEAEKEMQDEIKKLEAIVNKRERDEEIATAVAKAKAEMKKEEDAELQKSQRPSSCTGSCRCCTGNAGSTRANIQDGFVFHFHNHGNNIPIGNDVDRQSPGYVDILPGGLNDRRRSSVGDVAMGVAKRVMDRMYGIEARTAWLEREIDIGWERDTDRGRRRYWERERERDRYPGSAWGRGYF